MAGSVLAGVVAVRFNAHTGAWLVLLVYLTTLAVLYRAAAAEAARSRAGTFGAGRAAVQSVGAPSVRDLVARIQAMEEPVIGWISGRGVSSRVTASDRLALITNSQRGLHKSRPLVGRRRQNRAQPLSW